jgi:gas vesicle protein
MRVGKYENVESSVGTAVTFLLIGLGIGAGVGLLLAPKTGRQMRKDLRRSYEDALDTISEWSDGAKERFEEAVEKGTEFTEELRERAEPLGRILRRS